MKAERINGCSSFVRIDDMTWPALDTTDVEWQLRFGTSEQVVEARMRLASICSAYRALIVMPQRRRNAICSALKKAE